MENQTTEGISPSRSLCSKIDENLKKKITIQAIYRNGELFSCNLSAHYYYHYKNKYLIFRLEADCPCCSGTLGRVVLQSDGLNVFYCMGISCLIKN